MWREESRGGSSHKLFERCLADGEKILHIAALVGEHTTRIWLVYLAAATIAFSARWIDVHQVVAQRS